MKTKPKNMLETEENFALASPIKLITGKNPEDLTRNDLLKVIIEKQIKIITFHYTAIDGKTKELKIPICSRKHAELVLTEGERVDGSSLFQGIVDIGNSDLYVVPSYSSAFLNPFVEDSLDFVCKFLTHDGELATFTPDNILHKASTLLKNNHGFDLYAHGELEFYLLSEPQNRSYPLTKQRGYHAAAPFVKSGDLLNEMLKQLSQITNGNVKYAHHEVGCLERVESDFDELNGKKAEQVEIEFLLTPVEYTGDIVTLARWVIRNMAYKHGFVATFAPKLEVGHAGNGMHFHVALFKDGENIMADEKGDLSKNAKMLIGGLCHYAPSLTAFGNMVSASYLRLVPHHEAPTKVCWSERNRSALIRVPLGWTKVSNLAQKVNPQQTKKLSHEIGRQTVEFRSPDGSGFAHLLLAGMTLATDFGLSNEKECLEVAKHCHV
ncbi:MAG: glutamine synthetase family protein [FCB group bacterium]